MKTSTKVLLTAAGVLLIILVILNFVLKKYLLG